MLVMEVVMMITVTTHANVSCLNNYKMTFDTTKIQWWHVLSSCCHSDLKK